MSRRYLVLNAAQRAELAAARDHDRRPYLREMASALLKVADGQPAAQVAASGLLRRRKAETLYRWMTRYEAGGIANLVHRPRGHRGFSPLRARQAGADGAP